MGGEGRGGERREEGRGERRGREGREGEENALHEDKVWFREWCVVTAVQITHVMLTHVHSYQVEECTTRRQSLMYVCAGST